MLNIYQWFYKNIWPLKNKEFLVNYKDGKILIKAPIWIWKSFLFFDWPIYGLYKSSERTIINKDSKKWEIQILFSQDDNFYLIIRKISLTKTWKDSTKSELYSIVKDKNFIDYISNINTTEIIKKDNDILTLLNFYQIKLENLTTNFKQERELQDNLNSLLPNKEVALSTIFLPQNSENIFEIEPSNRINILKKVFWIMWIDDAKKIIDDKRKEIAWEVKWRENIENYKNRFSQIIEKIKKISENIQNEELNTYLIENIFSDNKLELDIEKVSKINFNIDKLLQNNKDNIEKILTKNEEYKQIKEHFENKKILLQKLEKQKKEIDEEIKWTKKIQQQLEDIKIKYQEIEKIKKEKEKNILEINQKYQNLQKDYENYIILENKFKQTNEQLKITLKEKENIDKKINNTNKEIQEIKNKIKANKTDNLTEKLKKLQKENEDLTKLDFSFFTFEDKKVDWLKSLEKLLNEIKINWKNFKEQLEKEEKNKLDILEEQKNLQNQIKNSEQNIDFLCEKINMNCPFISQISQKISWKNNYFEKQLEKIEKKLKEIEKNIITYNNKLTYLRDYWKEKNINIVLQKIQKYEQNQEEINKINKELQMKQSINEDLAKLEWQLKQLKIEEQNIDKKIKEIKKEIQIIQNEINEKIEIKKTYTEYIKYTEETNNLTKQINELNNIISWIQKQLEVKNKLSWKLEEIEIQIKTTKNEIKKEEIKIDEIKKHIETTDIEQLKNVEKALIEMKELFWIFNALVEDFNKNKLQLIQLKQKLWILKELTNIFWKELVIYVFSDYISSLESLINYFITDLVDFKLNIHLDEKWEKLEIFAEDELWQREIKSLSGGQKTALRIWWILWISKLQNSKILFLDETINNFDQESVQIISKKIKEFTEENKMKFYMITHSEILQQTDIWTDIVELSL